MRRSTIRKLMPLAREGAKLQAEAASLARRLKTHVKKVDALEREAIGKQVA